jgi:Dolichyl-phosphate-mannose-protein mannosyltransferase
MASRETTEVLEGRERIVPLPEGGAPKPLRSLGIAWSSFAAVTLGVLVVAAIRWSLDHPFGIHWDEASYFNDIGGDAQRARGMMLHKLAGRILLGTQGHPPAFRIIALPFITLFGFHTTLARLVSMACFAFSSWFIFLATRRVASRAAAAFAVLIFCLSPEVVSASIFFGTDAPLYLATAATLYYVLVIWSHAGRPRAWIGLGIAIGLGFLAKASFLLIGLPVLALWLVLSRFKPMAIEGPLAQWKAGALAFLIAAPWWLLNVKGVLAYGQYARGFTPNSLGPPSLATWMRWFMTVVLSLVGPTLSIIIGLLAITIALHALLNRKSGLTLLQKAALGACACAGIPMVLAQLTGTNHLLRHISPAVIPLAIAVGLLAEATGWLRSRLGTVVFGVLLGAQLLMIVTPVVYPNTSMVEPGFPNASLPWRVMRRFDQWDWKPLLDVSKRCGVPSPKIAVLGTGLEFNPPQIDFPWMRQGLAHPKASGDLPNVTWLWRSYEGPALDWQNIMPLAGQSDIVLTAPNYIGLTSIHEDQDNSHNVEFANRLSRDARFQAPIVLKMGRFQPVEVLAFLKNTLVCQSGPTGGS